MASTCERCATTYLISMLDVIMINIKKEKTCAFSAKRFQPERQMTASSSTKPQKFSETVAQNFEV